MSNELFTGGVGFTGFKKMANDVLMKNELANGYGAYQLGDAISGRSGYSFGPSQWDLSKGAQEYKDLFKSILVHEISNTTQVDLLYAAAVSHSTLIKGARLN